MSPIGIYAGFKGFDTTELNLIIRRTYVADGQFNTLLRTDTIVGDSVMMAADTAVQSTFYNHGSYFGLLLDSGKHYEIEIPAAARTYRIAGVFYNGPSQVTYDKGDYGCRQRGFVQSADSAVVDGVPTQATVSQTPYRLFFLAK